MLKVPDGTVVQTADGEVLADLVGAGTTFEVARGGRGGRGNASLANTRRKVPGFAELGEPGDQLDVVLELKSVADVGLVGFPSAGKSSLISVMSAAKPKIADYPFTTLVPNLGVVQAGDQTFTVADVPGLIPGAATGKGLGLEFLRHIERTSVLVHVLDAAAPEIERDPLADLDAIEAELSAYGGLEDRPRLVVLNKIDIPDGRDLAEIVRPDLEARGYQVFEVSAVTREGLKELTFALGRGGRGAPAGQAGASSRPGIVVRPRAVDEQGFTIEQDGDGVFVVRGAQVERWVRQTNFDNDEAIGYLADRLDRLGVEADAGQEGRRGRRPGPDRRARVRLAAERRRVHLRPARHRRPARGRGHPACRRRSGSPPAGPAGPGRTTRWCTWRRTARCTSGPGTQRPVLVTDADDDEDDLGD